MTVKQRRRSKGSPAESPLKDISNLYQPNSSRHSLPFEITPRVNNYMENSMRQSKKAGPDFMSKTQSKFAASQAKVTLIQNAKARP